MGRNENGRQLKRVNGDVYLAPMKFDQNRPITAGAPLKRCSNETSLTVPATNNASASTFPYTLRISKQEKLKRDGKKSKTNSESLSVKTIKRKNRVTDNKSSVANNESQEKELERSPRCSSLLTSSEKYVVPRNTAITPSTTTRSKSTFTTSGESSTIFERKAFKFKDPYVICSYEDDYENSVHTYTTDLTHSDKNYYKMINPKRAQRRYRQSSKIITATNGNSTTFTKEPIEVKSSNVEEITTATSLDLPASDRQLLPPTCSDEWSIKNQMATACSIESGTTQNSERKVDNINAQSNTDTTTASSKVGDGDTIRTPPGSQKVSEVDSYTIVLPVPPPPVSVEASLTKKPSFTLTFRKPKPRPRPRSIVTNSSSNRATLPSSASTPNPISPVSSAPPPVEMVPSKQSIPDEERNGSSENNNETKVELNNDVKNNNKDGNDNMNNNKPASCSKEGFSETQNLSKSVLDLNARTMHGKIVADAMPAEIAYQSAAFGNPNVEQTQTPASVYEPDADFWHSDSTHSGDGANKKNLEAGHHHHHPQPPAQNVTADPIKQDVAESQNTDKSDTLKTDTQMSDTQTQLASSTEEATITSYNSGSGSGSTRSSYSSYPYSPSYGYGYGSTVSDQSEGPFLRTEKGAIRFHLPGRIQHKTTIKVAHFPTGEDKNVVLNMKPDKEEDACEEEPMCANNQNFVFPSPTQYPPYSYNPYGYGPGSLYSPENYYRYYGYPPYY